MPARRGPASPRARAPVRPPRPAPGRRCGPDAGPRIARGDPMTETTTALASSAPTRYDDLVQPDRVHRLVYTDARIFSAELRDLFGRVWVYVGHESEIPQAND